MAEKNNRFSGMSRAELEKEARKQIVHSGLLALAALIVIAVACYAWFCSAGAVTAQGMAVRLSGYGFDLASAGDLPDLEVGMPEDVRRRKTFIVRAVIYSAAMFFDNGELEYTEKNMETVRSLLDREFDLP